MTTRRLAIIAVLAVMMLGAAAVSGLFSRSPEPELLVNGARFPAQIEIEGRSLRLVGAGVRRVMMFTPYAAALYLEREAMDAQAVLRDEQAKRVHLHLLADLDRRQIEWSFRNAVERNNRAQLPEISAQLSTLYAALRDAKRGEDILITYVPGVGTRFVTGKDTVPVLPGPKLGSAMMSIWFGPLAVDADLKRAMLGPIVAPTAPGN